MLVTSYMDAPLFQKIKINNSGILLLYFQICAYILVNLGSLKSLDILHQQLHNKSNNTTNNNSDNSNNNYIILVRYQNQ